MKKRQGKKTQKNLDNLFYNYLDTHEQMMTFYLEGRFLFYLLSAVRPVQKIRPGTGRKVGTFS